MGCHAYRCEPVLWASGSAVRRGRLQAIKAPERALPTLEFRAPVPSPSPTLQI